MALVLREWDTQFFNRSIYHWEEEKNQTLDLSTLDKESLIQSKISAEDKQALENLQEQNFMFVESECLFQRCLPSEEGNSPVENEPYTGNIHTLGDLAAETFEHSRFRTPWYPSDAASRLYRQWAVNAAEGRFDDVCLTESTYSGLCGFVSARMLDAEQASIGLIGIRKNAQGKGIGTRLLRRIEQWARAKGAKTLFVATQGSNTNAVRFYAKQGYILHNVSYWFYRQL